MLAGVIYVTPRESTGVGNSCGRQLVGQEPDPCHPLFSGNLNNGKWISDNVH